MSESFFFNIDFLALIIFLFCWIGYSVFATVNRKVPGNLFEIMHQHRIDWMKHLVLRDDRGLDVLTIGNLMRGVTFFASTSILIIACFVPLLGYGQKVTKFLSSLPFVVEVSATIWELKTVLLIIIFINAFFKYTWALRQYNYASVLIVSTKLYKTLTKDALSDVLRNAEIISNAGRHFTMGIRSFYFGFAALSWYVSAYLFIIVTIIVTLIIYRREFRSRALNILIN
jgi:uncharacterized membrane protein